MHDPFAMRPFFGYNFGHYLEHWLGMESPQRQMPKLFHVNWFRKGSNGQFLWPGFGENSRVIDWIFRRLDGEDCAEESPIGLIPKENALNLDGLREAVDTRQLFDLPKDFWMQEVSVCCCWKWCKQYVGLSVFRSRKLKSTSRNKLEAICPEK